MMRFVYIILLFSVLAACKNEDSKQEETALDQNTTMPDQLLLNNQDVDMTGADGQRPTQVNIPAGADGIVHHYICSDRCVGGHSPNPGNCPKCSNPLAHNQAWHAKEDQNMGQTQTNPSQNIQLTPSAGPQMQQNTPPPAALEQVNIPAGADGIVHHYICKKRCNGGHSPNAGNCSNCGNPLAHNQAWHNQ